MHEDAHMQESIAMTAPSQRAQVLFYPSWLCDQYLSSQLSFVKYGYCMKLSLSPLPICDSVTPYWNFKMSEISIFQYKTLRTFP